MKKFLVILILLIACPAWAATVYVVNDTGNVGKIAYKTNSWPSIDLSDATATNTTIEEAATAAGLNGTIYFDGGSNGVVYSDSQLGTVIANTMYTKAEGVTYRSSTDSGHNGTVTLRTTSAARTVRLQHSATFIGLNIDNTNASATVGALEVQLAIASLILTNVNLTSIGTGGGGHGLYINQAVTSLTISGSTFNNCSGNGMLLAASYTTSGTISNSTFNYNVGYGAVGRLGGITWTSCDFSHNQSHGFYSVGTANEGILISCTAHDNYNTAEGKYRHGFCLADGATNYLLDKCVSYNVDCGLVIQAGGNNSGNIAQRSVFITAGYGFGNNIGAGVFFGASNASYTNSANLIYNCVIGSETKDLSALYVGRYNSSDNVVKNSIIFNSDGGNAYGSNDLLAAYIITDNNLWYSSSSSLFNDKGTSRTFAEWKTASSQDVNSKNSNPLFVSSSDYHLQSGSPAVNAGTNIGLTTDYEGNYICSLPDIGAYERKCYFPFKK